MREIVPCLSRPCAQVASMRNSRGNSTEKKLSDPHRLLGGTKFDVTSCPQYMQSVLSKLFSHHTRMASVSVLKRLEERAKQVDDISEALKSQLSALRKTTVVESIRNEEQQLAQENKALGREAELLKQALTRVENLNGVKHIPLPQSKVATTKINTGEKTVVHDDAAISADIKPTESGKKETVKGVKDKGMKGNSQPADVPVDISRLDFRIGCIVSAEQHPDADSLYVEEVDLGEPTNRTILSGLVKHVPLEKMQGRLAIFLCNLKPAKMRGIMSQGMIMCASTPEKVEIIDPPPGVEPGDKITFEGYEGIPDPQLNPKKKIWEQIQPDLNVDGDGLATYKGTPFSLEGKGLCRAPTMKNVPIK